MRKVMRAPFSKAFMAYLNVWQSNKAMHPYTCANLDCRTPLKVMKHGLVCPKCGYTQDWAVDYGR